MTKKWKLPAKNIKNVAIVYRPGNKATLDAATELAIWFQEKKLKFLLIQKEK